MKRTKLHLACLIVCVAFFSLYGCAATTQYTPAGQVGSGVDYLSSGYSRVHTDTAISGPDDDDAQMMVPAVLGIVFTPYLVAPAAVMVNSSIGLIGDVLIPDRDDTSSELAGTWE